MIKITKTKLLIVDDDDLICDTLSDIFQEKDFSVVTAKNGRDAIDIAEKTTIEVAIIDIKLPDMNGITLLREFKKIYPEMICIVVTGYATLQSAVNALKDDADGYFLKPIIIEELVQRAQEVLEKRRLRRELKESEIKYREAYNRAEFYKDLFAHDINNILQSILSGLQLSEIIIGTPNKLEDLKTYIKKVKDQVIRGANLVSNLRMLSQLEETEISVKQIEICNILKNTITSVKNAYQDRIINIQIDSIGKKLYVQANDFLEIVFKNILNNAIRHNENPKVEIIIRISKEQRDNINCLKFEFIDNGIGIAETMKEKIFQRGYSIDKSIHGMGLGLSLVNKIIETYNGQIWVEDRVKGDHSKGSNFVLLIPEVD